MVPPHYNKKTLAVKAAVKKYIQQLGHQPARKVQGTRLNRPTIPRKRRPVSFIHAELGSTYFKKAYRMSYSTFWKLYNKLEPNIDTMRADKESTRYIPNGKIHSSVVLACALRLFAGGSKYDLCTSFGISVTCVQASLNYIINAINATPSLAIQFPTCHAKQREIALGFKQKSTPEFDCCVGALDGMLVWIEKPTEKDSEVAKCGTKKFFCMRKGKFGINLQAMCDSNRKFLFCNINWPGTTSDHMAWETSKFKHLLEQDGFLAPGLCIFGDNAYINSTYLATPYTNASGSKDDYNFFHSQLRINIECAFGMLTSRFGILRSALSSSYGLEKIKEMVKCMCAIHNFLIDEKDVMELTHTAADQVDMFVNGAFTVQPEARSELGGEVVTIPEPLLHGGEHNDDYVRPRRAALGVKREYLYGLIVNGGFRRPI